MPFQKGGPPTRGAFKKGQSGNPGGRPKVAAEVKELARQHGPAVITELARLALKAESEHTRVVAGVALLDRGYGKPVQAVEIDGEIRNREITDQPLTDEQWAAKYSSD